MMTKHGLATLLAFVVGLAASGCHHIASDYAEYLDETAGLTELPHTNLVATYTLTEKTEEHEYEFRDAMAGIGNRWIIELGPMLDDTMRSRDVRQAFKKLNRRSAGPARPGYLVTLHVVGFAIRGSLSVVGAAKLAMNITLRQDGKVLLSKDYRSDGRQAESFVLGHGGFSMRPLAQEATKFAINDILGRFLTDVNNTLQGQGGESPNIPLAQAQPR